MSETRCKIDGCNGIHQSEGLCPVHLSWLKSSNRNADRTLKVSRVRVRSMDNGIPCSHPGCDSASRHTPRGLNPLCKTHYWRHKHGMSLDKKCKACSRIIPASDGPKHYCRICRCLPCRADGCDRPSHAAGYCITHYRRFNLGLDIDAPIPKRYAHCTIGNCIGKVVGRGMCRMHYERWRKGKRGKKLQSPREFVRQIGECIVSGCDYPKESKELCEAHYKRYLRNHSMAPIRQGRMRKLGDIVNYNPKDGYKDIKVGNSYHGNVNGWIKHHRYVMEQHIGRSLLKHETVHHKNGDRADNRIENLELMEHSHPYGQRVPDKLEWAQEYVATYGDSPLFAKA